MSEPKNVFYIIEPNEPPREVDPCFRGLHQWAWLAAGGQECYRCGVRR